MRKESVIFYATVPCNMKQRIKYYFEHFPNDILYLLTMTS